jgi:NAD(P)-dependent dehydrogenase (short-subunit alcohol dehydrogenase family)
MRSSLRARVVVNDLRGEVDGSGSSQTPAQEVVDEIRKAGGEAIVSDDNVCDFAAAGRMIESAIDAFGGVDVLVCNEGILRDRMLVNMSESEWDAVIPPPPLIPILMGSRPPL